MFEGTVWGYHAHFTVLCSQLRSRGRAPVVFLGVPFSHFAVIPGHTFRGQGEVLWAPGDGDDYSLCPGKPIRKQAVTGLPILQEGLTYVGSGNLPEKVSPQIRANPFGGWGGGARLREGRGHAGTLVPPQQFPATLLLWLRCVLSLPWDAAGRFQELRVT